jgi:hypothetical protein
MPRIRLERSPNGDITSRAKTADRNHLMQLSHQRYLAASGLAEQPSMPSWIRVSTLHGKPCGKSVSGCARLRRCLRVLRRLANPPRAD